MSIGHGPAPEAQYCMSSAHNSGKWPMKVSEETVRTLLPSDRKRELVEVQE